MRTLAVHAKHAVLHSRRNLKNLVSVDASEPTIMPPQFFERCYNSSYFIVCSVLVAFLCELYMLGTLGLAVFLTSINYWRYPTHGARRILDMSVVAVTFFVHFHHSFYLLELPHASLYWAICITGIAFYLKSQQCGKELDYDGNSKYHVALHIVGNIANIVLYLALAMFAQDGKY